MYEYPTIDDKYVLGDKKIEEYCPRGFEFLTNVEYGENSCEPNATELFSILVNKLRTDGYIVQVADAFDCHGISYSNPTYQNISVYIKREDGKEIDWESID